jgi:uncharacterized protein
MREEIELAPKLRFNARELATEVVASLGNRGGGKSNGAALLAEALLDTGVQVIVLDYVGIWFSLRLEADGKAPSHFQIPVIGGPHGDIGLSPTAGAMVAEALAERHSSAVLDLSAFSKQERMRFATDFPEAFFRAKKKHPGPVQIVLEESQRFCPQRVQPDQARMLGAWEEIAEVGRNYGIGLHLVSQRPQKIAKDVLNLADTVFGYRTMGVLERKAIGEWVQEKGAEGRADVHNDLPTLDRGQAIVWSPSRQIFGKYQIRKKSTYDAGATPTHARADVTTSPFDLGALEKAMGRAADEAKANDPARLRAEIAQLKKQLAQRPGGEVVEKTVQVPTIPREWREQVDRARLRARALEKQAGHLLAEAHDLGEVFAELDKAAKIPGALAAAPGVTGARLARPTAQAPTREPFTHEGSAMVGNSGLRRMLIALAQRPNGLTNAQLGVRAGVSSKSGTFSTYLGRARAQGWVADEGQIRRITKAGIDALGTFDLLPEGSELAKYWIQELGGGASRMLRALVDEYPNPMTNAELGESAGISYVSGTFSTYLGRLRSLELVTGRGGELRASEELFT